MNFKPTTEQSHIVELAKQGRNILIQARAGCTKTTTCVLVEQEVPSRSLYLAFNADIAAEAKETFGGSVVASTFHSLAYKEIVKFPKSPMGKRLQGSFDLAQIVEGTCRALPEEQQFDVAVMISKKLEQFCASDLESIEDLPYTKEEQDSPVALQLRVEAYWEILGRTDDKISHSYYLKLFQLSSPFLAYDRIYLDEFQDTSPVCLDIVLKQKHAQLILVGDSYQAIYEWRGAVDAFDKVDQANFELATLTESFRYIEDIAEVARRITDNKIKLVARQEKTLEDIEQPKRAVICRYNVSLLSFLVESADKGELVYCYTDMDEVFSKLYHIQALYQGKRPMYPNKDLKPYTLGELLKLCDADQQMKTLFNVYNNFAYDLHIKVQNIKKILIKPPKKWDKTVDTRTPSYYLMTAHKCKGLEFDIVALNHDLFPTLEKIQKLEMTKEEWIKYNPQEINLMYVAATRAKFKLNLPETYYEFFPEVY